MCDLWLSDPGEARGCSVSWIFAFLGRKINTNFYKICILILPYYFFFNVFINWVKKRHQLGPHIATLISSKKKFMSKHACKLDLTSGLNTADKIEFSHAVDTNGISESTFTCKCLVLSCLVLSCLFQTCLKIRSYKWFKYYWQDWI